MRKTYKITLLSFLLIFLTTFNPINFNFFKFEKKNGLLTVQIIEVKNNLIVDTKKILDELQSIYERNIFFLKKEDLYESLNHIQFIERIEVKKKYPDTLIVKVFEEKIIGIFFKKKEKFFITQSSKLIKFDDNNYTNNLPSIFGDGAENNFVIFFNKLKKSDFPYDKIKNFYYFKIGRWDLELFDNKTIKLPFENVLDSINQAKVLIEREDFKKYTIIDLRLKGKVITE